MVRSFEGIFGNAIPRVNQHARVTRVTKEDGSAAGPLSKQTLGFLVKLWNFIACVWTVFMFDNSVLLSNKAAQKVYITLTVMGFGVQNYVTSPLTI